MQTGSQKRHTNSDLQLQFNESLNSRKNIQLDDIPSALLSEISSFLSFDDKIQFERTNNSIFVGVTYSKLPLYSLSNINFWKLIQYCDSHNDKYIPSNVIFNSLTINARQIVDYDKMTESFYIPYKFNHFQLFNHIKSLQINGSEWNLGHVISHLFEHKNLQKLNTLRIIGDWGDIYFDDNQDPFKLQLFTINEVPVEYIEISGLFDTVEIGAFDSYYYKWISSLKGFAINNHRESHLEFNTLIRNICQSLGNNLESLHKSESPIPNEIKGKLNSLKELCIPLWTDTINILLNENMNKLERIYLRSQRHDDFNINNFGKKSMELLFNRMIKNVKYIGLNVESHFGWESDINVNIVLMNIIIETLTNCSKNRLKIRIDRMNIFLSKYIDDIAGVLLRLINVLSSNCLHWMVVGYDWRVRTDNRCLMDAFELIKKKYNIELLEKRVSDIGANINFVMKNRECVIDRYHEQWIMECECCQQKNLFD